MASEEELREAAQDLVALLSSSHLTMACAESCTGGLAAAEITSIPGASEVLWGGFVAYSNDCKARILGVSLATIDRFGAVSRETAREMASGALAASGADIAFAITGVAGPDGGTPEKPVGLVWFAWKAAAGRAEEASVTFAGDREAIRQAAALRALRGVRDMASSLTATDVDAAEGLDIDNGEDAVYSH